MAQTTETAVPQQSNGRKLRSQEASRFKSDLSLFFSDYDEVIGNKPKKQDAFSYTTPIELFGSVSDPSYTSNITIRQYPDQVNSSLTRAEWADFSALEKLSRHTDPPSEDPLPDSFYTVFHRKGARNERSLLNAERGRVQHDREHIIRLLEELQGPEWLRALGVSGITESQKPNFEPARRYFTDSCGAIVDRFRRWDREEKRLKALKGRVSAAEPLGAGAQDSPDDEDSEGDDDNKQGLLSGGRVPSHSSKPGQARADIRQSTSKAPIKSSTVKVKGRIITLASNKQSGKRRRSLDMPELDTDNEPAKSARLDNCHDNHQYQQQQQQQQQQRLPIFVPEPQEFRSFFKRRADRDAALDGTGRNHNREHTSGRREILAWGVPIPDMVERDFCLGERILDKETIRTRERNRRRERREAHRK